MATYSESNCGPILIEFQQVTVDEKGKEIIEDFDTEIFETITVISD